MRGPKVVTPKFWGIQRAVLAKGIAMEKSGKSKSSQANVNDTSIVAMLTTTTHRAPVAQLI